MAWIAATTTAGITMTSFAYSTFETKGHAESMLQILVDRLNRIENKLDRLIEKP